MSRFQIRKRIRALFRDYKRNASESPRLEPSSNDEAAFVTGDEAVSRLREWCLKLWPPNEVDNADDGQIKDLFLRGTVGIVIQMCTENNNLSSSDMQKVPVVETLTLTLHLQREWLNNLQVDGDSLYDNRVMSTYNLIVSESNCVTPSKERLGFWWCDFYNTKLLDFYA